MQKPGCPVSEIYCCSKSVFPERLQPENQTLNKQKTKMDDTKTELVTISDFYFFYTHCNHTGWCVPLEKKIRNSDIIWYNIRPFGIYP